ncbi:PspC domain-containing protein [Pediococcus pentosaceus]|uniref:PspC domain-containing protein n=1 Tax=Pediococcus pentosaceus TaxID=1255 RepID=UPI0022DF5EEF|nr:PspC domain-containing protein [Pediococcus pentosaceus]MDB1561465.1 PspC domain-containing protein [Pediococcus pentosaceus]
MRNKLYKSRNDKVLSGVIGGFAEAYYFDTTLLRIIYTAVTLFTGFFPGLILYIVAMMVMPER